MNQQETCASLFFARPSRWKTRASIPSKKRALLALLLRFLSRFEKRLLDRLVVPLTLESRLSGLALT